MINIRQSSVNCFMKQVETELNDNPQKNQFVFPMMQELSNGIKLSSKLFEKIFSKMAEKYNNGKFTCVLHKSLPHDCNQEIIITRKLPVEIVVKWRKNNYDYLVVKLTYNAPN